MSERERERERERDRDRDPSRLPRASGRPGGAEGGGPRAARLPGLVLGGLRGGWDGPAACGAARCARGSPPPAPGSVRAKLNLILTPSNWSAP